MKIENALRFASGSVWGLLLGILGIGAWFGTGGTAYPGWGLPALVGMLTLILTCGAARMVAGEME